MHVHMHTDMCIFKAQSNLKNLIKVIYLKSKAYCRNWISRDILSPMTITLAL